MVVYFILIFVCILFLFFIIKKDDLPITIINLLKKYGYLIMVLFSALLVIWFLLDVFNIYGNYRHLNREYYRIMDKISKNDMSNETYHSISEYNYRLETALYHRYNESSFLNIWVSKKIKLLNYVPVDPIYYYNREG